jgi:molybdate transport system substrate-binding protein
MRWRVAPLLLAGVLLVLLAAGCGSQEEPELNVSAAASLRRAFPEYARSFRGASVRYSFAGSDALAAQVEQGVRPDVFASANLKLPEMLYTRGLAEHPTVFAANRLVLAVPRGSTINSLSDLQRQGVTIAVGSHSAPVGAYTETLLARLPSSERQQLKANIRDREPDVTGIVGKLSQGAVDAGFLYATDVTAAAGALRAIPLPPALRPDVAYAATVVRGAPHPSLARAFIAGLIGGQGRAALLRTGFLAPPGG